MEDELAKKLKDAGFPQSGEERTRYIGNDKIPTAYNPTLSELISACGEDFLGLNMFRKEDENPPGWHAYGKSASEKLVMIPHTTDTQMGFTTNIIHCMGNSTPEEAVSNLWLALNEKNPAPQEV